MSKSTLTSGVTSAHQVISLREALRISPVSLFTIEVSKNLMGVVPQKPPTEPKVEKAVSESFVATAFCLMEYPVDQYPKSSQSI